MGLADNQLPPEVVAAEAAIVNGEPLLLTCTLFGVTEAPPVELNVMEVVLRVRVGSAGGGVAVTFNVMLTV